MGSKAQEAAEEPKTIPIKILFDKKTNKIVAVEANKDFVDTLFSFLSLPLATIIRLLTPPDGEQLSESPFSSSINNLYESVQNLTPKKFWNPVGKKMLLH